jgi:hypothetical protein
MLSTSLLPAKSLNDLVERSVAVNLKSGAFVPTFGNSPEV